MHTRVFWVSFTIFAVLNAVENLIHYNIGKHTDKKEPWIRVDLPHAHDMGRILFVMFAFAALHGVMTHYFLGGGDRCL